MTIFHYNLLTKEGKGFGQWINSSIVHENICSLIHGDIKFRMILNILLGIAHP